MMAKLLFNTLVLLLLVQYALAQVSDDRQPEASDYNPRDPVSAFLDELGHLILDVDEEFYRQTAPKVELEDGMKERMYGRPRSEYFERIRDNYRRIQRVGSIPIGDLSVSSNLFGVNVKNEGRASAVDVSIPSFPIQLQVRSKVPTAEEYDSKVSGNAEKLTPKSSFASKLNFGDTRIKIDSTFAFPEVSLKPKRVRKISESGSKNISSDDGLGVKVSDSRFSSKIKVGDSHLKIDSTFALPDTSNAKPKAVIHESGSKVSDNAEEIATIVPKALFSNKLKTRNSAVKFNSAFSHTDASSETKQTERVDVSGSQLKANAKRFVKKSPETRFDGKIKVGDFQINIDSAFALPDISPETETIKRMGESNYQVSDGAETFDLEATESHFGSDFTTEDSQMQTDPAFAVPDASEEGSILNARYLVTLGRSGDEGKRGKRTPLAERANPERVALFKKTYKEYLSSSDKQDRPWDIYTKVRGRMLGDLLFSESTFDRLTKQALKNAKWILDSDLSPSKILEKLEEISKSVLSRRSLDAFAPQRSDSDPHSQSSIISMFRRSGVEPESDYAPDFPEFRCPGDESGTKSSYTEEEPSKETIMSAITNEGVHVKLRLGPELGNPYAFLHRILSAAEVDLSVEMSPKCAVESKVPESESLKKAPASLFVDLSDINQLDSFMRTLRKFRAQE